VIHREAAVRNVSIHPATTSRPCDHCGRPVAQPHAATHLFRYCRDNDGACQRASRRGPGVPARPGTSGLGDQVSRAVMVTERLERVVESLNDALHANLSPSGVERQIAAVRAEAASSVAAAHAQRDEARQDAHHAREEAFHAREEAEAARREADAARREAETATAAEQVARTEAGLADQRARQAAEVAAQALSREAALIDEHDALRERLAAAEAAQQETVRERDLAIEAHAEAVRERDVALTAVEQARCEGQAAQASALRRAEAEAQKAAEAAAEVTRLQAEVARLSADLEHARTEAGRQNNRLISAVATLREEVARSHQRAYDEESVRHTAERQVAALAARLRATEAERDAARTELHAARFQAARIDEQVSNLASALARLGSTRVAEAVRAAMPAPVPASRA
jgi:chromosome segregation ATPase